MAQMLEQSGAVAAGQFLEQVMPLAQASPDIMDKIDADQLVDELAQRMGVPASIIRSDEDVAKMRQERERARQEQAQQAALMAEARNLAEIGGVKTNDTVAGALLQSAGGGA